MLVIMLTACTNKSETRMGELMGENWIILNSQSDSVDIHFKDGESPFFEISMLTGSPDERSVYFHFFKNEDVSSEGKLRPGAAACRIYVISVPLHEVIEDWGGSTIITRRKDGSKHEIKIKLVNQPKF